MTRLAVYGVDLAGGGDCTVVTGEERDVRDFVRTYLTRNPKAVTLSDEYSKRTGMTTVVLSTSTTQEA